MIIPAPVKKKKKDTERRGRPRKRKEKGCCWDGSPAIPGIRTFVHTSTCTEFPQSAVVSLSFCFSAQGLWQTRTCPGLAEWNHHMLNESQRFHGLPLLRPSCSIIISFLWLWFACPTPISSSSFISFAQCFVCFQLHRMVPMNDWRIEIQNPLQHGESTHSPGYMAKAGN